MTSPTAGEPATAAPTANPNPNPLPTSTSTAISTLGGAPLPSASFSGGSIAAGLLLAALAAAALVMARRRHRVARVVEIVETASLGPRRSLVVARVGDELLLLGSSEGGIALLTTRPASLVPSPLPAPLPPGQRESTDASEPLLSRLRAMTGGREPLRSREGPREGTELTAASLRERLLARLKPRTTPPGTAAFESLLSESLEDLELRRKLAGGQSGSVR